MTLAQTYSWIFYALAMASNEKPVRQKSIELAADFINHASPTGKEVSKSVQWLKEHELIASSGMKLYLTHKGKSLLKKSTEEQRSLMKQWDLLTNEIESLGVDNKIQVDCGSLLPL